MAVPNYGALGLVNPLEVFAQSQKVQDTLTARGKALKDLQVEQAESQKLMEEAEADQNAKAELVRISNLQSKNNTNGNNTNGIAAMSAPSPVVPPTKPVVAKPTPKRLPVEKAPNFILNSGAQDQKDPTVKHFKVPGGNSISVDKAGSVWIGNKWVNTDKSGNYYEVEKDTGKPKSQSMELSDLIQDPILRGAFAQIKGINPLLAEDTSVKLKTEPVPPEPTNTGMGSQLLASVRRGIDSLKNTKPEAPLPGVTPSSPELLRQGPVASVAKPVAAKALGSAPPTAQKAMSTSPMAQPKTVASSKESVSSATETGSVDIPKANKVLQDASENQETSPSQEVQYAQQMNNSIMEYYSKVKESADFYKKKYQETGNQGYFSAYQRSHQKLNSIFQAYGQHNLKEWVSSASRGDVDSMAYAYKMMNPSSNVSFKLVDEPSGDRSFDVIFNGKKVNNIAAAAIADYANADTLQEWKKVTTELYKERFKSELLADVEKLKTDNAVKVALINARSRTDSAGISARARMDASTVSGVQALLKYKGTFFNASTGSPTDSNQSQTYTNNFIDLIAKYKNSGMDVSQAYQQASTDLQSQYGVIFSPDLPNITGMTGAILEDEFDKKD